MSLDQSDIAMQEPMTSGRAAVLGLLIALPSWVLTIITQSLFFNGWFKIMEEVYYPDFMGNGLNFLLLTMYTVLPASVGLFYLFILVLSIPVAYRHHLSSRPGKPPRIWAYVLTMMAAAFIVCLLLIGWAGITPS